MSLELCVMGWAKVELGKRRQQITIFLILYSLFKVAKTGI